MKNKLFILLIILIQLTAAAGLHGQIAARQKLTLTVIITNIKKPGDTVRALLWKGEKGFPKEKEFSYRKKSVRAKTDSVVIVFNGLSKGDYAVSCFYDENNNRKYDRSFWQRTAEPFGLSGTPDYKNLPVKYEDAKIELLKPETIRIELHYTSDTHRLFNFD